MLTYFKDYNHDSNSHLEPITYNLKSQQKKPTTLIKPTTKKNAPTKERF